jgi:hypothetical protein
VNIKIRERPKSGEFTLVIAERTADTMTTSLSFFERTAAFLDAEGEVRWIGAIAVMMMTKVGLGWERFINTGGRLTFSDTIRLPFTCDKCDDPDDKDKYSLSVATSILANANPIFFFFTFFFLKGLTLLVLISNEKKARKKGSTGN